MGVIKNILIYGGGLMGKNIAFATSSVKGHAITVFDIHPVQLEEDIRESTKQLVEKGVVSQEELDERISRIHFTQDLNKEYLHSVDLVIEAVFEDLAVKQKVFAFLEKSCRKDCIFCTNTSVIKPTKISSELKDRSRFIGTHFWNPAHLIPLVEVVRTDETSDETVSVVMDFMTKIGKEACLCNKDVPGFIGNRLQHALWREAISLVENGIADAATVDIAIKNSFGLRLPQLSALENADMVGLDLVLSIHEYLLPHLEDSHKPSPILTKLNQEGKLGFKSDEGFFKWTKQEAKKCTDDLNAYLIRMLYS